MAPAGSTGAPSKVGKRNSSRSDKQAADASVSHPKQQQLGRKGSGAARGQPPSEEPAALTPKLSVPVITGVDPVLATRASNLAPSSNGAPSLQPRGSAPSTLRTVTSGVPGERPSSPIGDIAALATRLSTCSTAPEIRIAVLPAAAENDAAETENPPMRKESTGVGRRKSSLKKNDAAAATAAAKDNARPPKRQASLKALATEAPKRKPSAKGAQKKGAAETGSRPTKRVKVNGMASANEPRTTINAVNAPATAGGASGSSSAWGGGQLPINALLSQVAGAGINPELLSSMQPKDIMSLFAIMQAAAANNNNNNNNAAASNAAARQGPLAPRQSAAAGEAALAGRMPRPEPTSQAAEEAALALRASVGLAGASSEHRSSQYPAGLDVGESIPVTGELSLWSGKIKHRLDNNTVELMCCTLLMPSHLLEHFPPTVFISTLTKRSSVKLGRHYALRCDVPFLTREQAAKVARLESMGQLAVCQLQHCQLVLVPVAQDKGIAVRAFVAT